MINTNLEEHLKNHIDLFESLTSILPSVEKIANIIIDTLENGNKILIAGNGGSAGDSQHFAAELTGRFKVERKSLAAIALTTDTSAITAIGNDYSFDDIFLRTFQAYGTLSALFLFELILYGYQHLLISLELTRLYFPNSYLQISYTNALQI